MTTLSKIEAIKAACVKVNPEIMELKFGCKVHYSGEEWLFAGFGIENKATLMLTDGKMVDCKQRYTTCRPTESDHFHEILGRDIQLADVLMAIRDKIEKDGSLEQILRVTIESSAYHPLYWEPSVLKVWNLRFPLHLQEAPVIDFIYSLIEKK